VLGSNEVEDIAKTEGERPDTVEINPQTNIKRRYGMKRFINFLQTAVDECDYQSPTNTNDTVQGVNTDQNILSRRYTYPYQGIIPLQIEEFINLRQNQVLTI